MVRLSLFATDYASFLQQRIVKCPRVARTFSGFVMGHTLLKARRFYPKRVNSDYQKTESMFK